MGNCLKVRKGGALRVVHPTKLSVTRHTPLHGRQTAIAVLLLAAANLVSSAQIIPDNKELESYPKPGVTLEVSAGLDNSVFNTGAAFYAIGKILPDFYGSFSLSATGYIDGRSQGNLEGGFCYILKIEDNKIPLEALLGTDGKSVTATGKISYELDTGKIAPFISLSGSASTVEPILSATGKLGARIYLTEKADLTVFAKTNGIESSIGATVSASSGIAIGFTYTHKDSTSKYELNASFGL